MNLSQIHSRSWAILIARSILGHDHLATTEIYLNLSPEHVLQEFHAKW